MQNAFSDLGLDAALVEAVTALGYATPTEIQSRAVPPLLEGRDVLGRAATGTGKTAAFALPLLHRLAASAGREGSLRALILVPTRELAMQVARSIQSYARVGRLRVCAIYGGAPMGAQIRTLERGVDVVVATPGRAVDHVGRGTLRLDRVETVILDEADEMLDMGFADDLETIFDALPAERQTALFSATMPKRIQTIGQRRMKDPVHVTVEGESPAEGVPERVREDVYVVSRRNRLPALSRVLAVEQPASVIVFAQTRVEVDELTNALTASGAKAEPLHGGLSQEQRDRVLKRFRERESNMLIATDVAARGLDIDHVSHVVNFGLPGSPEVYVHRIGRTGRAGRDGVAISIIESREARLLTFVERHTGRKINARIVPSVAELRAKRMTALQAEVEAAGAASAPYLELADALLADGEARDIVAATLFAAARAKFGAGDEIEIPSEQQPARANGRERAPGPKRDADAKPRVHAPLPDAVTLYVNAGRRDGVRPGDLVGAITNQAGVEGRMIGAIKLTESFMLVEIAGSVADQVLEALNVAKIRGRKIAARRDRADAPRAHGKQRAPVPHIKRRGPALAR